MFRAFSKKVPLAGHLFIFFRRCKKITCLYKDDVFTATDKGTAKCPLFLQVVYETVANRVFTGTRQSHLEIDTPV